jgi:hypothetical protein
MSLDYDKHTLQRLTALKLLRENIFSSNPSTYGFTDIAGDFPGAIKDFSGIFENVLPSQAIISKDPKIRKQQILEAVKKIKNLQQSQSNKKTNKLDLLKQMALQAKDTAVGSIVPSLALSGLINFLNFKKPWKYTGNKLKLVSPIDPVNKYKSFKNKKNRFKVFLRQTARDTFEGVRDAALISSFNPLISSKAEMSPEAINEAANILYNNPQITSLPAAEILSALPEIKTYNSKFKGPLEGLAVGTAHGALSPMPMALMSSAIHLATKKPSLSNISNTFNNHLIKRLKKTIPLTSLVGGITGLASGMITNKFNKKNNEEDFYNQA